MEQKSDTIVTNRQALRDYFIIENYEAGIALTGGEIKSIRKRRANLKDGYAKIEKEEIYLYNLHISPYEFATGNELDAKRPRKLLLRKSQIRNLHERVSTKGLAIVPLRIYLKKGFAKVEIALAKGKRFYDKREAIKQREAKREVEKALSRRGTTRKS